METALLELGGGRFEFAATVLPGKLVSRQWFPGNWLVAFILRLAAAGGARAVGVAGVWAPGVLAAVVPAGALRHLLGGLADVGFGVVDLSLGAAQLVGLYAVEAGEEELAV